MADRGRVSYSEEPWRAGRRSANCGALLANGSRRGGYRCPYRTGTGGADREHLVGRECCGFAGGPCRYANDGSGPRRDIGQRPAYYDPFRQLRGRCAIACRRGCARPYSFFVAQRSQEIALRIALGATGGRVVSFILREGMVQACIGSAVGLAGAYFVGRAMQSISFGVPAIDLAGSYRGGIWASSSSIVCLLSLGVPGDHDRNHACSEKRIGPVYAAAFTSKFTLCRRC